ncbi:MAG: glycosyl hydrolase, partial [Verrucomicrobiae bacterium]|nr:glycosyl hydrolase [Verrucomicrobiae bacterium]
MKIFVNRRIINATVIFFLSLQICSAGEAKNVNLLVNPSAWIEPSITARPWSYWWWMGSAVDETNIALELTTLKNAGWGGVHIIPIYGAKGWEDKYIQYLSPRWLEMLDFTVKKAREFGMDVDMTLGTGWCFGGPTVSDDDANARLMLRTNIVKAGEKYAASFQKQKIQRLIAFERGSEIRDLTSLIKSDGSIEWTPENGEWMVYAIWQQPSGQKVKRAAPGGEGHMLNLIYPDAMQRYLNWFDAAFANYRGA